MLVAQTPDRQTDRQTDTLITLINGALVDLIVEWIDGMRSIRSVIEKTRYSPFLGCVEYDLHPRFMVMSIQYSHYKFTRLIACPKKPKSLLQPVGFASSGSNVTLSQHVLSFLVF